MSWLCEMLAMRAAASVHSARVLWVDFDRFLEAPAPGLAAASAHLGADAGDATIQTILSAPTMSQYSKLPSRRFDARSRAEILRRHGEENAEEVRKGLDWLEHAAATFPVVRELVDAVERAPLTAGPAAAPA